MANWLKIIQLSKLSGNYNYHYIDGDGVVIIQLSKLSENYNASGASTVDVEIIQLSELSENSASYDGSYQ